MKAAKACVLAINGGSSSIKFALYAAAESPVHLLSGKIERIGLPDAVLTVNESEKKPDTQSIEASDHGTAGGGLTEWVCAGPRPPFWRAGGARARVWGG